MVSIKCNECNLRFNVRKQTAHNIRLYYCKHCSRLGNRNGMYGKGHLLSGDKNGNFGGLTDEHKKNLSLSRIGLKLNLSDETRQKKREIGQKIGAATLNKWKYENPEDFKDACRRGGINSLKLQSDYGRISGIEQKTINWLTSKNIEYQFQFNIDNKFLYDFKVGNFVIEVHGLWFHTLPNQIVRDQEKKLLAEKNGYTVLYIWEDEVNMNDFSKLEILCE